MPLVQRRFNPRASGGENQPTVRAGARQRKARRRLAPGRAGDRRPPASRPDAECGAVAVAAATVDNPFGLPVRPTDRTTDTSRLDQPVNGR